MKKLIFAFGLLCAFTMTSCIGNDDGKQDTDTQTDQVVEKEDEPEILSVTGVAVDGAMNSVYLKVGEDTLDYSFPDLESENRDSWDINDTLTVKYVETENGDSVIGLINENN